MPKSRTNRSHFSLLFLDIEDMLVKRWRAILKKEGHSVQVVSGSKNLQSALKRKSVDLVLLRIPQNKKTLEQTIQHIRKKDSRIRILLIASRDEKHQGKLLIRRLPVQGFYEIDEGDDKLLIWVEIITKSLPILDVLKDKVAGIEHRYRFYQKNREGLNQVIASMPDVVQTFDNLGKFVQGVLIQIDSFIETENSFLSTLDEEGHLSLLAGTGVFFERKSDFLRRPFFNKKMKQIQPALNAGKNLYAEDFSAFPLKIRNQTIGIFYTEKGDEDLTDNVLEMLQLFASQVAITLENTRLFHQASVDSLTQLYARRYFLEKFQEILRLLSRVGNQALSLIIIDLDHFKPINDKYGHLGGDKILIKLGRVIRESVRSTDIAGRLGGEEFGLILVNTSPKKAEQIAEHLRQKIEQTVFTIEGKRLPVTASFGISSFRSYKVDPVLSKDPHVSDIYLEDQRRLLRTADQALYKAKADGRNCVRAAKPLPILTQMPTP